MKYHKSTAARGRRGASSAWHPKGGGGPQHIHQCTVANTILTILIVSAIALLYSSWGVVSKARNASLISFSSQGFVSPIHRLDAVAKRSKQHATNSSSSSSARPLQPFVLAAGRGTTGTHTVYYATCKMGLPSVHFRLYCIPHHNATGFVIHSELLTHFQRLRYCLEKPLNRTCPEPGGWVKEAKYHIDRLIQSDIDAVHDTPYTHYMSYMIPRAKELRGAEPIVLLSERDPTYWSERRLDDHSIVPICRDILDNHTAQVLSAENSQHHGGYNYFDIFECVERFHNNASLSFQDMFTTNWDLKEDGKIGLVANAMVQYQASMKEIATYRVNLFEQTKEWKTKDLVNDIELQKPGLVTNPQTDLHKKTAQFVYDLWVPMGIYDLYSDED